MYLLVLFLIAMLSVPLSTRGLPPIKNGYYKIINPHDGSVLTTTQQGRPGPKYVITDDWTSAPTQIWKIRTIEKDGLQLVRNEEIRDNEVSKDVDENADSVEGDLKKLKLKMIQWNLVPHDDGNYEINNGIGCLEGHGKGKRISINEDCHNPVTWKFEFLRELPKK